MGMEIERNLHLPGDYNPATMDSAPGLARPEDLQAGGIHAHDSIPFFLLGAVGEMVEILLSASPNCQHGQNETC